MSRSVAKKRSGSGSRKAVSPGKVRKNMTSTEDRKDYLAVLPGLLMCLMTLMMLILDISVQGMEKKQYDDYPAMFSVFMPVAVIAGIIYIMIAVKNCFRIRQTRKWKTAQMLQTGGEGKNDTSAAGRKTAGAAAVCLAGFCLCVLISTLVNGIDDKALHGVPYRSLGAFHTIALVIIFMAVTSCLKSTSLRGYITGGYILIADLIAAAVLWDKSIGTIPAFHEKKALSAVFFNGNHYGYFLVMAVLVSAGYLMYQSGVLRISGGISLVLNAYVLIINHSMSCIIAVVTVLAAACVITAVTDAGRRKTALILLAIMAACGIAVYMHFPDIRREVSTLMTDLSDAGTDGLSGSAGHNRWLLWQQTAAFIADRPLAGYGCEGISDMLIAATGRANAHCELLSYAAFYGVPAAVLYALGVILAAISSITSSLSSSIQHPDSSGRETRRSESGSSGTMVSRAYLDSLRKTALMAAFGYFISSLFGVAMFYTAPFFFVFLGLSIPDIFHTSEEHIPDA